MYILLTGAKKNAGDFFIAESAKELFRQHAPSPGIEELPSWLPIGEHLGRINAVKALVLCGGPAFQSGLGDRIYPILSDLGRIRVPVIAFGLGWKATPGDDFDVEHVRLPSRAEPLLARLREDFGSVSCRDYLTCRLLERHRFQNTLMTGCPTWFAGGRIGWPPILPDLVRKVVFTPAEHPYFQAQSIEIMRVVRSVFPDAQVECSFHRGWTVDDYTSPEQAANALRLKQAAELLGFGAVDASGGHEGMARYEGADLHIGYRVHAHIRFLSFRKPSFLIAEDGRGRGALEALGMSGILGWTSSAAFRMASRASSSEKFLRLVRRRLGAFTANPRAALQLEELLRESMACGYPQLRHSLRVIDMAWETMRGFLASLPS